MSSTGVFDGDDDRTPLPIINMATLIIDLTDACKGVFI
jgi:hypothetical protein